MVSPSTTTYGLAYDAENRLTSVSGTVSASFVYNGDGQRVTATIGTTITTYIGGYFEWQGGEGKNYYFAGGQRVAMRTGTDLKFLLGDHLGSTSVTALASGAFDTETRYFPWGGVRWASGTTPTDYRFTGQMEVALIGLYFYNARWYDSALGRFVQADNIIPRQQGSQAWNRYTYVNNNPIRYKDPTGHNYCDEDGNCYNKQGWYRDPYAERLSTADTWKMMILWNYGVTISDGGGKKWDTRNLHLMYTSLKNIDQVLDGHLPGLVSGATFRHSEYIPNTENCSLPDLACKYYGWTSGQSITFYTIGDDAIRQMNIYHEVGHLIENMPGMIDVFSDALKNEDNPSFININGYIDKLALLTLDLTNDANYDSVQALQASNGGVFEQWADIFANYIAGNIDRSQADGPGMDMYNFVTDVLDPYIGVH